MAEKFQQSVGAGHCLQCGSEAHVPVNVGRDGIVQGIEHEQCWNSPLKWHGVLSGYNGPAPHHMRVFSFEGNLLWAGLSDWLPGASSD